MKSIRIKLYDPTKLPRLIQDEGFNNMWFKWKEVFQFIDPKLGRNRLITILKYEGYLGSDRKPIVYIYNPKIFCRNMYTGEYYISGKGLAEIRAKINRKRATGSEF